ncbi:PulJ/GspJ family protein [Kordiimonas aquimaris]|uniref:PulJ/GspJ family protein n=1 Tax=Kordiimonas aquimaris TaxID=707591 RepID=UPI0021D1E6B4|nr:prepilin-type N-terminal cleavage/methylation domain-containing protein [Kordiimonas aquimaris]
MTYTDQGIHSSEHGFSLIEMLIAVAILSLISLTLVVASTGTIRLFQRGVSLSITTSEVMRAQTTVSELLAAALTKEQFPDARFLGEKDTISWTAIPVSFPETPNILQFQLSLVPGFSIAGSEGGVFDLVLAWETPNLKDLDGRAVLVKGLGQLEFVYSNVTSENKIDPQYPVTTMPSGVWLRAEKSDELSPSSNTNWPDLYVRFHHR